MKFCLVIFLILISNTLLAENKNELENFAELYLDAFHDKLSYKNFKMVLDISESEVVIDKKYGTFKYKFHKFQIGDGEMIIEKDFDNINFQLFNNYGNPMISLNYKITFD